VRLVFVHKEDEMGGPCSMHVSNETRKKILVGKPERKRPPCCRWEDNINMDRWDWIHLAQDRDQWRDLVSFVHVLMSILLLPDLL